MNVGSTFLIPEQQGKSCNGITSPPHTRPAQSFQWVKLWELFSHVPVDAFGLFSFLLGKPSMQLWKLYGALYEQCLTKIVIMIHVTCTLWQEPDKATHLPSAWQFKILLHVQCQEKLKSITTNFLIFSLSLDLAPSDYLMTWQSRNLCVCVCRMLKWISTTVTDLSSYRTEINASILWEC